MRIASITAVLGTVALSLATCGSGSDARRTAGGSASPPPSTARDAAGLRLVAIGRFSNPVYVTAPPGDHRRVFVVEQAGRIRVVRGGHVLGTPFLDIRNLVRSGGEQGLLSMAFAPDYARSGLFYVYYTDTDGNERVVGYRRASPDRAAPGSARLVLFMRDTEPNHNGGQLQFGPDGLLYIGTGDGGSEHDPHGPHGNGQNLGTLLGKLLRMDPRRAGGRAYSVPRSNPFVGRAGARPEIYSYGLRNPWRFSFDRRTGDLTIGDVGQDTIEEIDFRRRGTGRGVNFGWRVWEGRRRERPDETAPGSVFPVLEHTHAAGWCSIIGGYVVRDPHLRALAGRYVYGDLCLGRIYAARLSQRGAHGDGPLPLPRVPEISSFGEDAAGRVYVASLAGPVYRLAAR